MGQAAVDLPDPLQDRSSAHAGGADDLLAQLAGDEIDRLLAESDVEKASPVPAPPAPPKAAVAAAPPAVVDPIARVAPPQSPPSPAPLPVSPQHAADVPSAVPLTETDVEAAPRVPLWLKPLQWINSPLDAGPASLRDTVGKVAIVTLVNAVAVLAYIALFRRHR